MNVHEFAKKLLELPEDTMIVYPDGNPVMAIVKDFTVCSSVSQDPSMDAIRVKAKGPSTYVILNVS